jgi:glycosyltransferase involved in cell wall biosynthesis
MKIALVYRDALQGGGYPRDVRWLSSALLGSGMKVLLLADEGRETDGLAAGVEIRRISEATRIAGEADLVHVFGPFIPSHALVIRSARGGASPLVLSTMAQLMPHAMKRKRLKKELYLRAISPWTKKIRLLAFGPEEERGLRRYFPRHAIFQASLGVFQCPASALQPSAPRKGGNLSLLFFGRNDRLQKGLDILLLGFSKAKADGAGIRLTIAGQPWRDSGRYIDGFLKRHGLEEVVTIAGPTDENVKWQHFDSADYFVFLSRWDGPPRPVREAIAAGLPLVVSPETNMGHLVELYGAGVQVPLDPDAVAGCFRALASTPDSRPRFASGVSALRDRLSWDRLARDYAEIYGEVLSGT